MRFTPKENHRKTLRPFRSEKFLSRGVVTLYASIPDRHERIHKTRNHQRDENITGHILCSFLALALRKELDRRLEKSGHSFEWVDITQDLKSLQEVIIEDKGKSLTLRTECPGTCGKVFQAVGVAIPPPIQELKVEYKKCMVVPRTFR